MTRGDGEIARCGAETAGVNSLWWYGSPGVTARSGYTFALLFDVHCHGRVHETVACASCSAHFSGRRRVMTNAREIRGRRPLVRLIRLICSEVCPSHYVAVPGAAMSRIEQQYCDGTQPAGVIVRDTESSSRFARCGRGGLQCAALMLRRRQRVARLSLGV